MSQLKSQLRKMLPRLSEEANKLRDPEARKRLMLLKKISFSGKSVSRACAFHGCSEDFYQKWGKRLLKGKGVWALSNRSRKPYRCPHQSPKRIEKLVLKIRRVEPHLGPERIANEIKTLYKIKVAVSTVYAILRRAKMVSHEIAKKLTKKHLKRYRRPLPE